MQLNLGKKTTAPKPEVAPEEEKNVDFSKLTDE